MANEFNDKGDSGIRRDAGDSNAGKLRDDARIDPRESSVVNLDAARTACEAKCGPMNDWMSMKEDPKGFQEKTEKAIAQTPEQIKATVADNDVKVDSVKAYIAALNKQVKHVIEAYTAQDALAKGN